MNPLVSDAAAVALSFVRAYGRWIDERFGFVADPRRYQAESPCGWEEKSSVKSLTLACASLDAGQAPAARSAL